MIDIKFAIKRLYNKIYIPVKKKEFGKCGKNVTILFSALTRMFPKPTFAP